MCYKFPVDIESSVQFKKPTKATVADFSKRAVRDNFSRSSMQPLACSTATHVDAHHQCVPCVLVALILLYAAVKYGEDKCAIASVLSSPGFLGHRRKTLNH